MIDGNYTGVNSWESDCGRFVAIRLLPSGRRWIVVDEGRRWSESFPDLEHARVEMAKQVELAEAEPSLLGGS